MKEINLTRLLIGGVAAGIVINLSEFVLWGLVLDSAYQEVMTRAGLAETSWAMTAYMMSSLVLGLAVAFLYAAMRPRFGARWQTAATAGGVLWVVAFAMPMILNGAIGLSVGGSGVLIALAWGLVELTLAGIIAGRLYREQEAPAAATARAY